MAIQNCTVHQYAPPTYKLIKKPLLKRVSNVVTCAYFVTEGLSICFVLQLYIKAIKDCKIPKRYNTPKNRISNSAVEDPIQDRLNNISSDLLLRQLREASSAGSINIVRTLVKQWFSSSSDSSANSSSPFGPIAFLQPALETAGKSNQAEVVSFFLDHGLKVDRNSVSGAIAGQSMDALQTFLDHGWDNNSSADFPGNTAIMSRFLSLAIPNPCPIIDLRKMMCSKVLNDMTLLKWFLAHGASSNPPTRHRTPLDVASAIAGPESVKLLIQHGSNIKVTNALHTTVRSHKPGRNQIVECLLDAGLDIDAVEHAGTELLIQQASSGLGTALHYVAREGREDLVRLLVERGANVGIQDTRGQTPAELAEKEAILVFLRFWVLERQAAR
ncbi:ankyrin repeat-containing domain protein [Bisporella sp. PMI_857]|nr:ankyrin repeat-containing domain protein [Bisporella sp. PMI_857]